MSPRLVALVPSLALALACDRHPVSPAVSQGPPVARVEQQQLDGTGIVLNSITGVSLPLIGQVGEVVVDQAVITNLVVESVVGAVVGLEAEGVLQVTGGVLGTDVVTQDFITTVAVTSSGPGQCDVVTIDLGQIRIDALVASVEVPAATVAARGSGAVGSLLCVLGELLTGLVGGIPGVGGLIDAINNRM